MKNRGMHILFARMLYLGKSLVETPSRFAPCEALMKETGCIYEKTNPGPPNWVYDGHGLLLFGHKLAGLQMTIFSTVHHFWNIISVIWKVSHIFTRRRQKLS